VKRLLLVSHRPITQEAGPAARWRSLVRRLPEFGWEIDVVSAPERAGNVEFAPDERSRLVARRRATVMAAIGRLTAPAFALAGVRPEALPLSMTWVPRGAAQVRHQLGNARYDLVVASGPPMASLLAPRLVRRTEQPPLIVEFRDLWAANPAFDRSGGLLGKVERWTINPAAAIVACTPEAEQDLRRRHPRLASRIRMIPNGFEPELLRRDGARLVPPSDEPLTILHSGTLTVDRPLAPLLRVLAREPWGDCFRLVLHGYLAPSIEREVAEASARADVRVLPPSTWSDAIDRITASDVGLVAQGRGAGDATAVASKVYEYLALGKPVLCITDGGATEGLLRRLGADALCARLDDDSSITRALERLRRRDLPDPPEQSALAPYNRRTIAREMAQLFDRVADSVLE
jgi:glycosyltransferase involved in cell wall biosynthesis